MSKKQLLLVGGASIVVAVLAHALFFYETAAGRFMVGPNDGLGQILPFKHFLYQQLKNGHWSYSIQFGLGAGTFSQLAYYFSTSMVYSFSCLLVYVGEMSGLIANVDLLFWGKAAVYINAARLALILFLATSVFHYMNMSVPYAFLGAVFYGVSVMYFTHGIYWEFFADAFLWLPLLVLGVEKLIREENPFWLIAAMSLSLINNFYFSYVHFIFLSVYALLRWLIRFPEDRLIINVQLRYYVAIAVLSFFISAVAFIPAVSGFLSNYRPPFTDKVPLFSVHDNLLYGSKFWLLPPLFVLFACIKQLYVDKTARLFIVIALLFCLFHYSPFVASVFNGFSAPQFRFEYIGTFAVGGVIARGMMHLQALTKPDLARGVVAMVMIYMLAFLLDDTLSLPFFSSQYAVGIAILAVVSGLAVLCLRQSRQRVALLCVLFIVCQLLFINVGASTFFSTTSTKQASERFMSSESYDSPQQGELIEQALKRKKHPLARIEWMVDFRNNTPLIQGFYGNSAYSSVLNGNILQFYYDHLQIDMGRESVSRYYGFGDRANLHSLMNVQFKLVDKKEETAIPYGFTLFSENDRYALYENQWLLPFARATSNVFLEEDLEKYSPLVREHAMLEGIVLASGKATAKAVPETDVLERARINAVGGTYKNGTLTVTDKVGGIDIVFVNRAAEEIDDYVSFYLQNQSKTAPRFTLQVNDYKAWRKSRSSIYKTDANDLTIRVPSREIVSLRVPKGIYTLKDLSLQSETYQRLQYVYAREANKPIHVSFEGRTLRLSYDNKKGDTHLTVPIPYEKGWEVSVNGKKQQVEKANYAFLGTAIAEGKNEIVFSYLPPYFRTSLLLSGCGLLATATWIYVRWRSTS
ncbi:YfhO family protein [Shouchella clausii]|uniref:YfhO family protein n=1 Tax=Shouchella clausii TaxID=79880 RepID=UPI0026F40C1D|nr:YfhO family protein [Shouchella clausii]MDO7282301.1 YfhO family protein [Shouchella clausii]MDO7302396.1 YfhO family protein [Shouchella clausii]